MNNSSDFYTYICQLDQVVEEDRKFAWKMLIEMEMIVVVFWCFARQSVLQGLSTICFPQDWFYRLTLISNFQQVCHLCI